MVWFVVQTATLMVSQLQIYENNLLVRIELII